MKPIGLLMMEHRLIERMIRVLERELSRVRKENNVDIDLVEAGIDFLRTYADRTHHGKEEDILFDELEKKDLSPEDRQAMEGQISDHVYARGKVKLLSEACQTCSRGEKEAIGQVLTHLEAIVNFYPTHIEKEDRRFFRPSMKYFPDSEQDGMLEAFYKFDREMIHDRYRKVVEALEEAAPEG